MLTKKMRKASTLVEPHHASLSESKSKHARFMQVGSKCTKEDADQNNCLTVVFDIHPHTHIYLPIYPSI